MISKKMGCLIIAVAAIVLLGLGYLAPQHDLLNFTLWDVEYIELIFFGSIIVIFVVGFIIANNNRLKKLKLIDSIYGADKIVEKLGYKDLTFPIIAFGGDRAERVHFLSYEDFLKDYPLGTEAEYVIDATGKKYIVSKKLLKDIFRDDPRMQKVSVYVIENSGEIVTLEQARERVVSEAKKLGKNSAYQELIKELETATDFKQLAEVMSRGIY